MLIITPPYCPWIHFIVHILQQHHTVEHLLHLLYSFGDLHTLLTKWMYIIKGRDYQLILKRPVWLQALVLTKQELPFVVLVQSVHLGLQTPITRASSLAGIKDRCHMGSLQIRLKTPDIRIKTQQGALLWEHNQWRDGVISPSIATIITSKL